MSTRSVPVQYMGRADKKILWEGDRYRAVILGYNVEPSSVTVTVQRDFGDTQWPSGGRIGWCFHKADECDEFKGWKNPVKGWAWASGVIPYPHKFDQPSIMDAVTRAVEQALELERRAKAKQQRKEEAKRRRKQAKRDTLRHVEAAVEVQEMASSL